MTFTAASIAKRVRAITVLATAALGLVLASPYARAEGPAGSTAPAAPAAVAGDVVVAAAASLREALNDINAAYTAKTGKSVKFAFGATGALTKQIEEGAPFQLFLAADEKSVDKLEAGGKTDGPKRTLVRGRVAVVTSKASGIAADAKLEGVKAALKDGKLKHFSIANPELAPYGKAAREVLEHEGLLADVEKLIVQGENVAQATQYVATGAAEAGLVAASLTHSEEFKKNADAALVPSEWHKPVSQGMALMKGAGPEARAFAEFLAGPEARASFEKFGFEVP